MKAVRLSVKDVMIAVGLIAILMGAFRFHPSIGSFLAGVVSIATIQTSKRIDRLRAQGHQIRGRDRAWQFAKSIGFASILIATSMVPVFGLLPCFMPHSHAFGPMVMGVIGASVLIGCPVAFVIRRLLW